MSKLTKEEIEERIRAKVLAKLNGEVYSDDLLFKEKYNREDEYSEYRRSKLKTKSLNTEQAVNFEDLNLVC